MPTIAELLSAEARRRLTERWRQLAALDHMMRQPGGHRPAEMPTLADLAARNDRAGGKS